MTIDLARPFILLDDARAVGAGPSRLYADPVEVIAAATLDEVGPALVALRQARARGLHAAGFIAYEAGLALEGRLGALPASAGAGGGPLLWFGLFDRFAALRQDEVAGLLPDPAGSWAGRPRPRISRADHAAAFGLVRDYIAAGDIYQANLSFRADVPFAGHPLALYAAMRGASHGGWGGVVFTGRHWLLSCSPELFFELDDGMLVARPMKGTAPRGRDAMADAAIAGALAADPKERAENLMIVDLLRNDLSRVAAAGSVAVPALFTVETYPTIHTLTSTVTARLAPDRDAVDVVEAIFPCGSVTGAPKIRAMEIIAGVEADARGPYTGSIGWLDPAGNAAFNVAIRTLALEQGSKVAELGLGSAVVADSTADGEWRECLAKGAFVTAAARPFDLIETMRFDPMAGLVELERHLSRMKASAEALDFAFDRHGARNELQAATFRLRDARRVRLMLSPSGALAVEVRPMPATPATADVRIAPRPVVAEDVRLHHKTSDRAFYDDVRRVADCFEVVFHDRDGRLTEGSFTNIFVERDGVLVTPPLARGLLPGVLRDTLIADGRAVEGDLAVADLAQGFFIGNALRGLIPARLA
ncbi:para-aminobenzoate synthetase / 4-amino-4-deoxychorismate lyase [Sphingomonas laterariae]|uniref:Probable branched-chain-amino-acid aminotransferase n=1 Tax=Edaphosphingomonas laterariae TaxID=861865 RepID=A0A239G0S2_9SPHN|nr:aminodeoxychorismate synthase component I [Sphingomonas laterariae]SNS61634.1 para-aminobenzoate synthetase / 4-amino-4-deoxychorismate lyase [Sphingomonas laterariae]